MADLRNPGHAVAVELHAGHRLAAAADHAHAQIPAHRQRGGAHGLPGGFAEEARENLRHHAHQRTARFLIPLLLDQAALLGFVEQDGEGAESVVALVEAGFASTQSLLDH